MNAGGDGSAAAAATPSQVPPPGSSSSSSDWDVPRRVAGETGGLGAGAPAVGAADLFAAALQRLGTAPSRGGGGGGGDRRAAAALHRECDSDGFFDSDDERVAGGGGAHRRYDEEEEDEEETHTSASSSSSSSSDGMWGTFTGGEPRLPVCGDDDDDDADGAGCAGSSGDDGTDGVFFVPEPIFDLTSLQRKAVMPCLGQDELHAGATVWVADEDDVATQLSCHFSAAYPPVCNGRLSGEVVRHTGRMTLVQFRSKASDLHFTLCLPTSCLSLVAIEPYDGEPRRDDGCAMGSGAYGMLGPRAAGRGRAAAGGPAGFVRHCLYEALPAYDCERLRGTRLEAAQEAFFGGSFEKALAAVSDHIDAESAAMPASPSSGAAPAAETAAALLATSGTAPSKSAALVDALVLRSRIFVFLERHREALEDAQRCVLLEPRWVRGYLSLARAHCGVGAFSEAAAATAHACIMLPYSQELERIKDLNSHMHHLQSQLRAERASCYVALDGFYRKRLRTSAALTADTVLCTESTPVVAMHSVFVAKEPAQRCPVCFRPLGFPERRSSSTADPSCSAPTIATATTTTSTTPTTAVSLPLSLPGGTDAEEDVEYCSTECTQRASLYRPLELRHRAALEHVRSLILSKGAVTLNVLPLEMAAMTVRLFLMVVTIHRRLLAKRRLEDSSRRPPDSSSPRGGGGGAHDRMRTWPDLDGCSAAALASSQCPSPSPPVSVEASLRRLGVYPLSTEPVPNNKLEELKIVYDVLTTDFKAEDRAIFSSDVFAQLYSYVAAYFTPVDLCSRVLPGANAEEPARQTVFFLPQHVGCIEMAKSVSYTTSVPQRQRSGEAEDELVVSHVMERPTMDDDTAPGRPHSTAATHSFAGRGGGPAALAKPRDHAAMSDSGANCLVQMAPRPALLELVTVVPVAQERALRCVPVTVALSSDVA
ncbi:hypothetical protein NESM_000173300 [Novymonas esmeraldas]|uniref:Uncharacterized protein n=1 Tax=Novymonas esmeraldas TaxID=1808958 RepID=A0AAW0F755_9TRYP